MLIDDTFAGRLVAPKRRVELQRCVELQRLAARRAA